MCGIFGYWLVTSPTGDKARDHWDALLYTLADRMESRGRDSWGWILIEPGATVTAKGMGKITVHPQGVPPHGWRAGIGHTRFATWGEITQANTHPFAFGDITMVHNGGIFNADTVEGQELYSVDSQALAARVAGWHGEPDASDLRGYGACAWADLGSTKSEVYICRMVGGDLEAATVRSPDGGHWLVWASKMSMIRADLKRQGFSVRDLPDLGEGRVYRVHGPNLYRTERQLRLTRSYRSSGSVCRPRGRAAPNVNAYVGDGKIPCEDCHKRRGMSEVCEHCDGGGWAQREAKGKYAEDWPPEGVDTTEYHYDKEEKRTYALGPDPFDLRVFAADESEKCGECGYYFSTDCNGCLGDADKVGMAYAYLHE